MLSAALHDEAIRPNRRQAAQSGNGLPEGGDRRSRARTGPSRTGAGRTRALEADLRESDLEPGKWCWLTNSPSVQIGLRHIGGNLREKQKYTRHDMNHSRQPTVRRSTSGAALAARTVRLRTAPIQLRGARRRPYHEPRAARKVHPRSEKGSPVKTTSMATFPGLLNRESTDALPRGFTGNGAIERWEHGEQYFPVD